MDATAQEEAFVYATNQATEAKRQTELLASFKNWRTLASRC
ncbi:hypothetical protein DESA109040_15900 [Deinococcus saxicola]